MKKRSVVVLIVYSLITAILGYIYFVQESHPLPTIFKKKQSTCKIVEQRHCTRFTLARHPRNKNNSQATAFLTEGTKLVSPIDGVLSIAENNVKEAVVPNSPHLSYYFADVMQNVDTTEKHYNIIFTGKKGQKLIKKQIKTGDAIATVAAPKTSANNVYFSIHTFKSHKKDGFTLLDSELSTLFSAIDK